jgi:hypothetical protein
MVWPAQSEEVDTGNSSVCQSGELVYSTSMPRPPTEAVDQRSSTGPFTEARMRTRTLGTASPENLTVREITPASPSPTATAL